MDTQNIGPGQTEAEIEDKQVNVLEEVSGFSSEIHFLTSQNKFILLKQIPL